MALRVAALGAVVLLTACAGGGDSPVPQVAFAVSAVTPTDAAKDVPLTQQINLVFTLPVDAESIDTETVQVVAESGDVIRGTREVPPLNPAIVRFIPDQGYLPFAVHTIRVRQDVKDRNGSRLDRDYEFTFQAQEEGPVLPTQQHVDDLGSLLKRGRFFHRMTLLPGLNRFLVAGGYLVEGQPALGTAENLIPALTQSTIIPNTLRTARAAHVQVLLNDGRVLLAGGEGSSTPFVPLRSCEIFDPDGFTFTEVAPMNIARSLAHATVLPDGRVLVTGGQSLNEQGEFIFRADAEIYDPATDEWRALGARMEVARSAHFSALTPAGDVVIIGGTTGAPSATLWRQATETFSPQLGTPFHEHFFGAATVLPDGRPFVVGGTGTQGLTIWDPQFGFLQGINQMPTERAFATATAFADGRVLIVGGFDLTGAPPTVNDTVDVFFPIGVTGKFFRATDLKLPEPTSHHAAALGPFGSVWITGGLPLQVGQVALRQVTVIHPE